MPSFRFFRIFPVVCALVLASPVFADEAPSHEDPAFADLFVDETLRIDYFHTGDSDDEYVSLDQMWRQGQWAGSTAHLIDEFDLGRYYAKLYDAATGRLIFSRGFDSYFGEWQTTGPAGDGVLRTYHESALVPFPLAPVHFTLEARGDDLTLHEIFRVEIDPAAWIIREDDLPEGAIVVDGHIGGDPHECVDVAILGEGYTAGDEEKFRRDVARFTSVMMGYEPYASLTDRFNIRGVLLPSQQSGCDEPSRGVHRNTALGCTFDSLGSERYMLTEDNRAIRDVAAHAPYDILYIMVNHERYGGGGIYNLFCTFTSDNQWSEYVFLHEFGHCFAGLADEYYTSSTAYDGFYTVDVEPHERNITALLDPAVLKWGDLVTESAPVPTEWNKAEYDRLDIAYQQRRNEVNEAIATLMREGAPQAEIDAAIEAGEKLSRSHQDEVDAWMEANPAYGIVGAFEGAGYVSEGMYRSQLDCIMFTKGMKPFCDACRRAIREVVEHHGP